MVLTLKYFSVIKLSDESWFEIPSDGSRGLKSGNGLLCLFVFEGKLSMFDDEKEQFVWQVILCQHNKKI